ncbi:MAG TPA: universal stress protein [Opitutaceae bacterium]|nr:universal stress protein [Opitutaceae bacterium]
MKTILVPLDFSSSTKEVLDTATTLAQALDASLVLLHAWQAPAIAGDPLLAAAEIAAVQKSAEEFGRTQLERTCEQLTKQGLTVKQDLRTGLPSAVILDQAHTLPADLVVMGSHGHTALYDLLLGGTAHAVLKHSPCPVVIVPSKK